MGEALAMTARATSDAATTKQSIHDDGYGNYQIPSELFAPNSNDSLKQQSVTIEKQELLEDNKPKEMPRGGWQADETALYSHSPEDVYATNTYDAVRENQYEQLHQQMYNENGMVVRSPQPLTEQRYVATMEFLFRQ
jgi:hypothetical protein